MTLSLNRSGGSRVLVALAALTAGVTAPRAQSPPADNATFEVVSIKPTIPGSRGGPGPVVTTSPGRFFARGSLQFFLQYAFALNSSQIAGGPDWIRTDRFDIEAIQPQADPGYARMPVMLRAALVDRFKLVVHREARELPVFALVVAAGGPKLVASGRDSEPRTQRGVGELRAVKLTMRGLASLLSPMEGRLVLDRTGLEGEFDFTLRWNPDEFSPRDPRELPAVSRDGFPPVLTAVQEQLGLKLEPSRAPIDVLVVDHVEKPAEN
ncbi:MAG TPA: TIGR03435 family protein [Vicinamibacterales bacterium]